ncbi:acyl-CoA thioesterase [Muribaculum intestinale]|uniref:acyl-CoA thioesterase n=2 Tax=Muribaculum intestinale TaxID=1796646 RepID=UPI0025A63255|nr:acyl-CoA thioesterase [Muribaculum intestinale]
MMRQEPVNYVFEMPIKVRDYEVDSQGIVNNANYQHYLEHTRHMFCEQAGVSFRDMHAAGIDPVVRRIEIDYLRPLGLGDSMVSRIALFRQGPMFVFRQDIFTPEGEPVVHAMVDIVCLENGRLTRGERLAEAFAKYL